MIKIVVDNEALDLYENTTVSYEINSPLFSMEALKGAYSFPINFPPTPKNNRLLKFFNIIDNSNKQYSYSASLFVHGILLTKGTLKIKWQRDKFIGNIYAAVSQFADAIKDKKLETISMATPSYYNPGDGTPNYRDVINGTYPSVLFQLPMVYNDTERFNFLKQPVDKPAFNSFNNPSTSPTTGGFISPLTPMPYLAYVLKQVFKSFGFTIGGTLLTNADFLKLIIFNNNSKGVSGGSTVPFLFNLNKSLPDITIEQFIKAVRTRFCACIDINNFKKEAEIYPVNDILSNAEIIDITHLVESEIEYETPETKGFTFSDKYAGDDASLLKPMDQLGKYNELDSVADLTALLALTGNNLNDLRYVRDARIYYRYGKEAGVAFNEWNPLCYDQSITPALRSLEGLIITGTVADLTALNLITAVEGAIYFVTKLNQYYVGKKTRDGIIQWEYSSDNLGELTIGDGANKIEAEGGTLSMIYFEKEIREWSSSTVNARSLLLPKSQVKPIYWYTPENENLKDLRLLIYHGMQNDGNGRPYPFASNGSYLPNGTKSGDLSLTWNGADGFYQKYWSRWASILDNAPVATVRASLDINFLINLSFKRKVRIKGVNFYLKTIQTKLPLTGLSTLKLIKA